MRTGFFAGFSLLLFTLKCDAMWWSWWFGWIESFPGLALILFIQNKINKIEMRKRNNSNGWIISPSPLIIKCMKCWRVVCGPVPGFGLDSPLLIFSMHFLNVCLRKHNIYHRMGTRAHTPNRAQCQLERVNWMVASGTNGNSKGVETSCSTSVPSLGLFERINTLFEFILISVRLPAKNAYMKSIEEEIYLWRFKFFFFDGSPFGKQKSLLLRADSGSNSLFYFQKQAICVLSGTSRLKIKC